jgi:hypothetical protein
MFQAVDAALDPTMNSIRNQVEQEHAAALSPARV